MRTKLIIIISLIYSGAISAPRVTVINSTQQQLQLHVAINSLTIDDLKPIHILIGLPNDKHPELQVQMLNEKSLNVISDQISTAAIKWIQIQKLRGLWVGTLQITPGTDGINNNQYFSEMSIALNFASSPSTNNSKSNDDILALNVINWPIAKNWKQSIKNKIAKVRDFPTGQWLKFGVADDGIYQLNGTDLIDLILTIDQHDTRSFILYTGSNIGRSQSQTPGSPTPNENLSEIAFQYTGSTDGTFSENDKIIFYGRGSSGFDLDGTNIAFNQNLFFNKNAYWLFIPDDNNLRGKRIAEYLNTDIPTINLDYGIQYQHIENDFLNPFQSGLGWVEQSISTNNSIEKTFDVSNPINDISPILTAGFQGATTDNKVRPTPSNSIGIRLNSLQNSILSSISWIGLNQRSVTTTLADGSLINGSNSFYFSNNSNDNYSQPFFDYLTLFYGGQLILNGEQFEFLTPVQGQSTKYTLKSDIDPIVWNITDISNPIELQTSHSGSIYNFNATPSNNANERIVIFDKENIPTVENIELIGNKSFNTLRNNSTQAEHIIIAPQEYINVANKFTAHRDNSIFAALEVIYDEFSGGNPDPMAIRNFIDWTQNNWQSPTPVYVFICGDADYDYRNITGNSNNIVPTVEVGIIGSFATDDRLAAINGTIPEIAIGRFPARNVAEAEDYIDKLIEFETNPEFGLWRQRVTLVADDAARPEDTISELNIGKSHTINSEILADIIPATFETNKLYMLEFPEESDATSFGVAKPQATSALFDILEKGTAIVNYIGHGSAHQWAQERLLFQDRGDLQAIETGMKLPLWIAGTCSWGHFDNIESESFSEELIRQPMNGASAIITTSRPITVTSNQYYEEQLFNKIFPNQTVSELPIGVILQSVKTGNQEGEYFHLFGDPAMKLTLPTKKLTVTSVAPDTLQTLAVSEFRAEQNITNTGGEGFVILNDAERAVTREYNYLSNTESLTYNLPGSTLFRGKFSFDGNHILGNLRVPKDVTFLGKPASLKLYIISNDSKPIEALGAQDSLYIVSGDATSDNFGPIISFETSEKRSLRSGDHIQEDDDIFIRLTDPLGINLTGETGHNIVLTNYLNDDNKIVTDDFIYDNNSITTGTIPLALDENSTETHLALKAWDSANNPTESEIKLYLLAEAKLKLFNVTNFPNPFAHSTQFTFELTRPADVSIAIFTLGGRKIMQFDPEYFSVGFHAIDWNGKDAFGDKLANGVYLYRLKAVGDEETAEFIGRLAKYE
ncbi:type IX secretion system sortase PorU [bacterium]|nr:type IX secretion system sortase PorU [bacterium]